MVIFQSRKDELYIQEIFNNNWKLVSISDHEDNIY